jgi:hypothetical protein
MAQRGKINPKLGCTDSNLLSQIRSALRRVWRNSSRRVFIESVRIPYTGTGKFKYAVTCNTCGRVMGQSEKERDVLSNGALSKKWSLCYEVNHLKTNHALLNLSDLGDYAVSLLLGDVEILCKKCHKKFTKEQNQGPRNNL